MKRLRLLTIALCLAATGATQADSANWTKEEAAAVSQVADYLIRAKHTARKLGCPTKLVLMGYTTETAISVMVSCWGKERDSRLFVVDVDKKTGAMEWDREQYDEFRPVPKVR